MTDKVAYWLEIADYDLETASAMIRTKRWLYVAFMCHQTIEKTLKAYWCATREDNPPYTHSLIKLSAESGLASQMSQEQNAFMAFMMPMNIEARYPEYKQELFKLLSKDACEDMYERTKQLQQWIKDNILVKS